MRHFIFACVLIVLSSAVSSAETAPPAGNAVEELAKTLAVGHPDGALVWLDAGGSKTFAFVETPPTGMMQQGGVVLLHDLGAHGDSSKLIAPLRRQLAQHGWTTLSAHIPAINDLRSAPAAELAKQVREIAQAAAQQLGQKGIKDIAIVAHGVAAPLIVSALTGDAGAIRALVALSPIAPKTPEPALDIIAVYREFKLPLLDIYGERDYPIVIEQAGARANAQRPPMPPADAPNTKPSAQPNFRQLAIPGANHDYRGQEDLLARRIVGWLKKTLAPGN